MIDDFDKALALELKEHPWTQSTVELTIGAYFASWAREWLTDRQFNNARRAISSCKIRESDIQVIERSAYTKAVKALTIVEAMSEDELAVKTAYETLKELGEIE